MLAVIGDIAHDVVVWLAEEPRLATDTKAEITTTRGGSAANVAAFAAPRYPTRFIGCVGDDAVGQALTRELEGCGVDVRVQVRDRTATIVVLVDTEGERMMFPSRGASGMIERIEPAWLEDLELLHLTGYSLQSEPSAESVLDAARHVKAGGGRISFDVSSIGMVASYGRERFKDLIVRLRPDYISANRDETVYLGLATDRGPGPLLDRVGPQTTLLARAGSSATRIFRDGALVAEVPVQPVDQVRDVTGAGDAFNGGFLTALLKGADPVAACEAAHDLARRVLVHPGAADGS
jgi:sugar/nucleoside kinase (ribokinase family)